MFKRQLSDFCIKSLYLWPSENHCADYSQDLQCLAIFPQVVRQPQYTHQLGHCVPELLCLVTCNSKEDSSGTRQLLSVVIFTAARTHTTSKTFLGKAHHHGTMSICFGCGRNLSLISGCLIHGLDM